MSERDATALQPGCNGVAPDVTRDETRKRGARCDSGRPESIGWSPCDIVEGLVLSDSWCQRFISPRPAPDQQHAWIRVAMTIDGGTFAVPVEVNGSITLHFVVDSGASTITIPSDVVSTLMRTGSLKKSDFGGRKTFVLADGSTATSDTFTIKSLKLGSAFVENVEASVAPASGPLLLGQSFLQRFKGWSIDNVKHELLLYRD